MTGLELIAQERARQIEQEGFTPEHDHQHLDSELGFLACYYALPCQIQIHVGGPGFVFFGPDDLFEATGFHADFAKRGYDRVRNLTKAGALIAAEIDRLTASGEGAA